MIKEGLSPNGKSVFMLGIITILFMGHVGLVTDGEFNSLRSRGATQPLSILQIRSDSRKKFARMNKPVMEAMLTVTGYTFIRASLFRCI